MTPSPPAATAPAPERPVRAPALPREARREAIVDAVLPLLMTRGASVTTREIAAAAGVAEGTLFRSFADKTALIDAAVDKALDLAPLEARLDAIDRSLPTEAQLVAAVAVLQERMVSIWQLLTNVGFDRGQSTRDARERLADVPALVRLLAAAAPALPGDPLTNARLLRALAIAGGHPHLMGDAALDPEAVVALFLDGVRGSRSTRA